MTCVFSHVVQLIIRIYVRPRTQTSSSFAKQNLPNKETRSNGAKYYNFSCKSERFKQSPTVYMLSSIILVLTLKSVYNLTFLKFIQYILTHVNITHFTTSSFYIVL